MSKKVFVNKDECTSCALCTDGLPQYFRMDNDDLAETHNNGQNIGLAEVPDKDLDKVQELIDDCPAECIQWK